MSDEHNKEKQIHRRDVLKWGAVAGAAVAIGASGLGDSRRSSNRAATASKKNDEKHDRDQIVPFTESTKQESQRRIRRMCILRRLMSCQATKPMSSPFSNNGQA
ncbi:twin-arginine translocation signal domain-containing protein [Bacillus velezensis]